MNGIENDKMTARRCGWLVLPLALLLLGIALVAAPLAGQRPRDAAVTGIVHGASEAPLGGATVTLAGADGAVVARVETDAAGAFEIPVKRPEGTYRLHIAHPDHVDFTTELPVVAGERQSLVVTLLSREIGQRNAAVAEYNAGVEALGNEELEGAIRHFTTASSIDPSLELAHLGLADSLLRAERGEEAKAAIATYRRLAPTEARGLRLAYEIYRSLGDEASLSEIRPLLEASEAAPVVAADLYNEGVAALHAGDTVRAIDRFRAAAEAEPGLTAAWEALATVYYDLESYPEALAVVDRLLAEQPENLKALRVRFLVLDAQADPAAAEAVEALAAVDATSAAQLLYQRAELDFRSGEPDAARRALERVLELQPEMAHAHFTLGLVHASAGESAAARSHLQRFLELAPDDPEAESAREILEAL